MPLLKEKKRAFYVRKQGGTEGHTEGAEEENQGLEEKLQVEDGGAAVEEQHCSSSDFRNLTPRLCWTAGY